MRCCVLLDHRGQPIPLNGGSESKSNRIKSHAVSSFPSVDSVHSINTWFTTLANTRLPPFIRAQDPFANHPWIFAAALTTSIVASQAPFTIFNETDEELDRRKLEAKKRGRTWRGPPRGKNRTATRRYINLHVNKRRFLRKVLESDPGHPIADILEKPNPYQSGNQLFQLTHLWMALRGELFWVLEMEDGSSVPPGQLPERIWPLSPDLFSPILENRTWGELIGWKFRPPHFMSKRGLGFQLDLPLTDVVHFKSPNPVNPLRGLSRMTSIAISIETDMLSKEYMKAIYENGGDPGGIITYDSSMEKEEEDDFLDNFNQRYSGSHNARKTLLLQGGFKYTPVGVSSKDMQDLERSKWTREEALAVMNTPPSVLGVTDFINYATQLGQDRNFWDKHLIPLLRAEETTLDFTLFFEEPDSVVGLFDMKDVEALRSGVDEKIDMAKKLCGAELHVPPEIAYDVVGLEMEEYEGQEEVLVSPMLTPLSSLLEKDVDTDVSPVDPFQVPDEGEEEQGDIPPVQEAAKKRYIERELKKIQQLKAKRWREFVALQEGVEFPFRRDYKSWILAEKRIALSLFDEATKELDFFLPAKQIVFPENVIPSLKDAQDRLKSKVRPIYTVAVQETFEFTKDDFGGITVFEIDDERVMGFFEKRERKFLSTTPNTIRKNLTTSLSQGIGQGETLQQLRKRVAQVYDISASSAKTLTVARTESASFINGVRNEMFRAQQIELEEWITAQDEVVRETHVIFGKVGPKPHDFNYLEEVGKSGQLLFPGDPEGPSEEVINCRCLKVPVS